MLAKGFGFASFLLFAVGFVVNIGFDVGLDASGVVDATRLIDPNGFGGFDDAVVGFDVGLEKSVAGAFSGAVDTSGVVDATRLIPPNGLVGFETDAVFDDAVDTSGDLDATRLIPPNGFAGFETDGLMDADTGGAAVDVEIVVAELIGLEDGIDFDVIAVAVVVDAFVKVLLEGNKLILAKGFGASFFVVVPPVSATFAFS